MVELAPFTEADLPLVDPWFDDAETQRWLGDRRWPRMVLSLASPPDRFQLLAWQAGRCVALVDVEHLERSSLAIVVAPEARGRGIARDVIGRLLAGELSGRSVHVGVEEGNAASARVFESLGFRRTGTDEDGFHRFVFP